jgi:glycosyltransferase involved in cell wall biosynthesis
LTNWQLSIRDDGSTDNTLAIIQEITQQDSLIQLLENNLGDLEFNDNFRRLLRQAHSPYTVLRSG